MTVNVLIAFAQLCCAAQSNLTPGITRRAISCATAKLSMRTALFAVGCMPLLDCALTETELLATEIPSEPILVTLHPVNDEGLPADIDFHTS